MRAATIRAESESSLIRQYRILAKLSKPSILRQQLDRTLRLYIPNAALDPMSIERAKHKQPLCDSVSRFLMSKYH